MQLLIRWLVSVLKPITKPIGRWLLQGLTWVEKLDTDSVKDFHDKEDIVIKEFADVFAWEVVVYGAVIVVFVSPVVWGVFEGMVSVTVLGMWLSAIGSISLARSAVRGKAGIIVGVREDTSRRNRVSGRSVPHQGTVRANCRHTVHGVFGAVILAAGFGIQIAGSALG